MPDRAEAAFEQALSRFSDSLPRPAKRVLGPVLTWLGAQEAGSPKRSSPGERGGRDDAMRGGTRSGRSEMAEAAAGEPRAKKKRRSETRLARLKRAWRSFLAEWSKTKDDLDADAQSERPGDPGSRRSGADRGGSGARERRQAGRAKRRGKAAPRGLISAPATYLVLVLFAAAIGFGFRWMVEPEVPEAKAYQKALNKVEKTQAKLSALKKKQAEKVKDLKREFAEQNKEAASTAKADMAALEAKLAAAQRRTGDRSAPAPKSGNCLLSGRPEASAKALRDCVMEFNRIGG